MYNGPMSDAGKIASLLLFIALLAVSCAVDFPTPSIAVTASQYYTTGSVSITCTFIYESGTQKCRYILAKMGADDYEIVETKELSPASGTQGVLDFTLADGRYRLEFSVLSTRGAVTQSLEFLTKTTYFTVDTTLPTPPSASLDTGTYQSPIEVFLSHPDLVRTDADAVRIVYTLDATDPTASSTAYAIGIPIPISTTTELRARVYDQAGNASPILTKTYTFATPQAPTISAVSPASLNVDAGSDVIIIIDGSNFTSGTTVSVTAGGIVKAVNVASASRIYTTLDITALAAGANLTVTVSNPYGSASNSSIVLAQNPAPTVSALSPSSGSVSTSANLLIQVTGTGFTTGVTVQISDADGTVSFVKSVYVAGVTDIRVIVDLTSGSGGSVAGMNAGTATLTVTNPSGEYSIAVNNFTLTP
jgi:hypothetical protein